MSAPTQEQRLQAYQRLTAIARDLASTLDLNELLRRITRTAVQLSAAQAASILLYDAVNKHLYFQTTSNTLSESVMQEIIVPPESIAGWVANHRQAVIVEDVHQDARYFDSVEKQLQFPTQSIIALPLITKEKLIGVLEVINKNEGQFNAYDLELLEVLGAQAAVAIENARLFQQSDLISDLVHELRTPLMSLNAIAYLLEQPTIGPTQRIDLAHTIQLESTRLNELTTRFLDLARLESGRTSFNITQFDLNDLLRYCIEAVQPQARQTQISLTFKAETQLAPIEADRDKLEQVVLNLLSNAIKYNRPLGSVSVRSWYTHEHVYFSVRDDGLGMSEEDMAHLFSRFFRAQRTQEYAPGTGLGLPICKRIVEAHHGKITAQSRLNAGTTFTVELPRRLA